MKKKKKRTPRKSTKSKKRSEAAKKAWRTRKRKQREKENKRKEKLENKKEKLDEFIKALEDSPGNERLKTLFDRHYGEKGFKFEIENEILKVSISTKKTRGKKFSVRG